jgi:hypothetical protein
MIDINKDPRFEKCLAALIRLHNSEQNPRMRSMERGMVAEFLVMFDAVIKPVDKAVD